MYGSWLGLTIPA
jgi:hypothetical protein